MRCNEVAVVVAMLSFLLAAPAFAQDSAIGLWKNVDSDKVSLIRIQEENGQLTGKIEKIWKNNIEITQARCTKCTDGNKDKMMVGLRLIWDMRKDGNRWSGGKLLDPETGRIVNCRLETAEAGTKLIVRASVAFLSRTLTWTRAK